MAKETALSVVSRITEKNLRKPKFRAELRNVILSLPKPNVSDKERAAVYATVASDLGVRRKQGESDASFIKRVQSHAIGPRQKYGFCECGKKMKKLPTCDYDPEGIRNDYECKCGRIYGTTKGGHSLVVNSRADRRKSAKQARRQLIEKFSHKGGKDQPAFKKVLERARKKMDWETMADRNMDSLDFHDVSAWRMRQVLSEAFEAGLLLGYRSRPH